MFDGIDAAQQVDGRRWTAIASFTLQAALVAAALALPLLYPQGLPEAFTTRRIFVPVSQGSAPRARASTGAHSGFMASPLSVIFVNRGDAVHVNRSQEVGSGVGEAPDLGDFPGISDPNGVIRSVVGSAKPPAVHAVVPHVIRTSVIMEGHLAHRVSPEYPVMARQMRIEGPVLIRAIISREGSIEMAQVVSGHPLLTQAALQAVRQWKYRPYVLNGEPVEVETEITVNFVLQR